MQQLTINTDVFHLPSAWNELSAKQLLKITEFAGEEVPLYQFFIKIILVITGLVPLKVPEVEGTGTQCFWFKRGDNVYLISSDDIAFICSRMKFFFSVKQENGRDIYYIESSLTKNLIPIVQVNGKTFYGPADALTNITFEEYIHAETNLDHFRQTHSTKYINRLIATLYRPSNGIDKSSFEYKGDPREPFNDFLIDTRAQVIKDLPDAEKEAIMLFYNGCRKFIAGKFPNVFSGSGKSAEDVFMEYMKLVNSLADSDITKKEQIRKAYLYDVFITLEDLIIEQKKLLKKIHHGV